MTEFTPIIDRQRPPILNARLSQAVERNELSYERALCIEIEATRAEVQALRDEIVEFGRSAPKPAHAAGAWLLVACAWLCLFIVTLIHH